jgi:putative ABC transport system substrate-binding protein
MTMRRREFITLLGGAAVSCPLAARGQHAGKVWHIGYLAFGSKVGQARYRSGFPQGMSERGYAEGRDYTFTDRYADGDRARLPLLAEELVRIKPDIMLAGPTVAVLAAKQGTASIPIVGINMSDPVGLGLVASEARPGTNVTGVLTRVEGMPGKQLEIVHDLIPTVGRIGVLANANDPTTAMQQRDTERAAAKFGVSLVLAAVHTADEVGAAFQMFVRERADAAVVFGDAMFMAVRRQIAAFALASRLPTVYNFREHVEDGGLISLGVNLRENYRRAAYFVDRILNGAKPADLPLEFPTKVDIVINLKTAKALGLTVPHMLLVRADEVIE